MWNMQVPSRPGLGKLRETVQNFAPDLVGITVNTANWYDALECAKLVKSARPSSHLVMGGVHLSVYPEETINREEIDSIVIGEGEDPLLEMATRLSEGWSLEGVAGVWFKKDGGIIRNPFRPVEKNPDRFPAPDRSEFSLSSHRVSADRLSPAAVIITSRGCPFQCTFCCTVDKIYRKRSPQNIVSEMLSCKEMGYKAIDFYDDIFNISKKQVLDLCEDSCGKK